LVSTQSRQNVHSKVQIMASVASGGRSLSQHSQDGRNASMAEFSRSKRQFARHVGPVKWRKTMRHISNFVRK
jgi:hypothetical protein